MPQQNTFTRETDVLTHASLFGWSQLEQSGALIADISAALTGPLDEELRMARLAYCLVPTMAERCLIQLTGTDGQLRPITLEAESQERAAEVRGLWERLAPTWEGWGALTRALGERTPTLIDERPRSNAPEAPIDTADSALLEALGCRSALLTPIVVQGQPAGIITLGAVTPGRYDEVHLAWATEIARRAATAVENARLYANERRARAEAEAAIRARDELTALIAHDLRNPLAVVHGQAELLQRHLQQPELDRGRLGRSVDAVRSAAAQMRLLLDDLHDIAHLRAGQPLHLEPAPTDLVALARRAATIQQAASPRHELSVDTPLPALWCVCDPRRLERVLANLLGNAIKFSPAGGPVTLAVSQTFEAGSLWATLSVADQGVGIPPGDLAAIFAPYHRARNVIGTIRGTGLGLASVHAIVTQHGGSVAATSTEGVGSTFTVQLPLEQDNRAVY